jgi:hypothetical protein
LGNSWDRGIEGGSVWTFGCFFLGFLFLFFFFLVTPSSAATAEVFSATSSSESSASFDVPFAAAGAEIPVSAPFAPASVGQKKVLACVAAGIYVE